MRLLGDRPRYIWGRATFGGFGTLHNFGGSGCVIDVRVVEQKSLKSSNVTVNVDIHTYEYLA